MAKTRRLLGQKNFLLGCLLVLYSGFYGTLIWQGQGLPAPIENFESFAAHCEALNLYHGNLRASCGLTDEAQSPHPEAHPYVHTHQGNFPRLFVFILYSLGLRTTEGQIVVTTFTVGVAVLLLAFSFFSRLVSPGFAFVTCGFLITDYMMYAQWNVSTYRIWHGLFLFLAFRSVQGMNSCRPWPWRVLAFANFACLFYYEIVFAFFVTTAVTAYSLWLHRRRPHSFGSERRGGFFRTLAWPAGGAVLGMGVLLVQLSCYYGPANILTDIRLIHKARNYFDLKSQAELDAFYRKHCLIENETQLDARPLLSWQSFTQLSFTHHFVACTPFLAMCAFIVLWGALLAAIRPWVAVHWGGRRKIQSALFLGVFVLGCALLLRAQSHLFARHYQPFWKTLVAGTGRLAFPGGFWLGLSVVVGARFTLAGLDRTIGRRSVRALGNLSPFLVCGFLAYLLAFLLFPGYVFMGYLSRNCPMGIFFTLPLIAAAFYLALRMAWRTLSLRWRRRRHCRSPLELPARRKFLGRLGARSAGLAAGCYAAGILLYWGFLQANYNRLFPPDRWAFLKDFQAPPFDGATFVTDTYTIPIMMMTGNWVYYLHPDEMAKVLGSQGTVYFGQTLGGRGLWVRDHADPKYRRPDYLLLVSHRNLMIHALGLTTPRKLADHPVMKWLAAEGTAQGHRLVAGDANGTWVAIRLDWSQSGSSR